MTHADYVEVALTGRRGAGKFALIDAEYARAVQEFTWHLNPYGYAAYTERIPTDEGVRYSTRRLHRYIAHLVFGIPMTGRQHIVDHINRNKLDNRAANLRLTDYTGNNANRGPQANNTSGFKGVAWDKEARKWKAVIRYNRRLIHLGRFSNIEDAARAYDEKARELFGEFAGLNFP